MRSIHTHSKINDGLSTGLNPLVRSAELPDLPNLTGTNDKNRTLSKNGSFSEFTPLQVMRNNLSNARKFISKQKENLYGINDNLNLMQHSLRATRHDVSRQSIKFPNHRIYLHALFELSHEHFMNHPLFGDGSDPPLRMHFKIKGNEITHPVPIYPLFNSASFLGILHSGHLPAPPSPSTFNSSIADVLQFILENETETSKLLDLNETLENPRFPLSVSERINRHEPIPYKPPKVRVKGFISRMLSLIRNATRPELCSELHTLRSP